MKLPVHFTVLHIQKFSAISSNLVKIALFKDILAPGNLEMTKYTCIYIKNIQKYPDSNLQYICGRFSAEGFSPKLYNPF